MQILLLPLRSPCAAFGSRVPFLLYSRQVSWLRALAQSCTVICAVAQRFVIRSSSAQWPKKFVAHLHLNFSCLSCLMTFLRSKYLTTASCLPCFGSELGHSFKRRIMCKAVLLKITWLAVALHLAFGFAFSRRLMTAGNPSARASFWIMVEVYLSPSLVL